MTVPNPYENGEVADIEYESVLNVSNCIFPFDGRLFRLIIDIYVYLYIMYIFIKTLPLNMPFYFSCTCNFFTLYTRWGPKLCGSLITITSHK